MYLRVYPFTAWQLQRIGFELARMLARGAFTNRAPADLLGGMICGELANCSEAHARGELRQPQLILAPDQAAAFELVRFSLAFSPEPPMPEG